MAEKLNIARYKMSPGTIWQDDLDIATVYEEEYLHLLAAAPLMLEALEMLARHRINHLEREGDDGLAREELTIIQAAIAAAKGE